MKKSIVIAAMVLAWAGTSFAQGQNAPFGEGVPCQTEAKKLCPGVTPGGRAMYQCMKSTTGKLSYQCRQWVKEIDIKISKAKADCQVERDKYCADVIPGNGAVLKCLKKNMIKLSRQCAESIPINEDLVDD